MLSGKICDVNRKHILHHMSKLAGNVLLLNITFTPHLREKFFYAFETDFVVSYIADFST